MGRKNDIRINLDTYGNYLGMEKGCIVLRDKKGNESRYPIVARARKTWKGKYKKDKELFEKIPDGRKIIPCIIDGEVVILFPLEYMRSGQCEIKLLQRLESIKKRITAKLERS